MIVDTSVVFEALVDAPYTGQAIQVLGSGVDIHAPDHILIEFPGALTRAVRRGDITADFAVRAYGRFPSLLPHLHQTGPLCDQSFRLSLELAHPLYDCLCLALAEQRRDVLVTADLRFTRKLQGTAYAERVVHLADWRG